MQIQPVELAALTSNPGAESAIQADRLTALSGVKTELTIVAGRAVSTVGDVLSLRDGAVLTLDTALNAPFDVMLGETVIARGELVAVGEQFGIRVVQVQPALTA